jgi:hypothetical protein
MKRILPLLFAGTIATATFASAPKPVRYDARVWQAVQTYDLATLSKDLEAHTHELVGVKFNFRGKDIRHMKPNWYQSSIWQGTPGENGKFAHVPVMVAKADLDAFKSIPTNSGGGEVTVYGRVEYELATKYRFLRLVGRNATKDAAGNATVTW